MTVGTLPPIAPEDFAALKRGDEAALATIFKTEYDPLEREAEAELHDPLAAARAVEHAFVHAWADREKVDTPDGFQATLLHALHEETARERRRLNAAHRMGGGHAGHVKHEPVPVDAAWQKVVEALHPKVVDDAAAATRRHEDAKHHAAHAVAELSNRRSPWVVGGLFALTLAAGIGLTLWLDKGSEAGRVTAALNSPDAASVKTEPGQMGSLKLADGGEVSLAPMSGVKLPPGYNTRWRAVAVEGSAAFTVAHNPELPFEARAGKMAVVATGTKFVMRKFADESRLAVRVLEGSVLVRAVGEQEGTAVAAGQTVIVTDGVAKPATAAEAAELTGWVDGAVTLNAPTLEAALPELRKWWGLVLEIGDPSIASRPVAFSAPVSDAGAAIAALEQAANVKLVWEKKQMVLRPAPGGTGR